MLVVSDIDDVFLPKPNDLLVNLTESRSGLEALLGRIPEMFQDSHAIGSALGPALQAAYKLTVLSYITRAFRVLTFRNRVPSGRRLLSSQPACRVLVLVRLRTVMIPRFSGLARY